MLLTTKEQQKHILSIIAYLNSIGKRVISWDIELDDNGVSVVSYVIA